MAGLTPSGANSSGSLVLVALSLWSDLGFLAPEAATDDPMSLTL